MNAERVRELAKEPSTWRGIGGLLVAFGLSSAGAVDAVVAAGFAVMSAVEILRREVK